MKMAEGLDTGDMLLSRSLEIGPDETAGELFVRVARLGAEALSESVTALADGTATRTPQEHEKHTYASMLSREMSPIDWNRSARAINCQVRGLIPWPCASTELAGTKFKVYRTAIGGNTDKAPGTILSAGKRGIEVACGDGNTLLIDELQAEGSRRMAAPDYLRGHPVDAGTVLG